MIETSAGVGIPYPPVSRVGRPDNHGYVDLKRCPEFIHSIPELQGNPHLFELVQSINRPGSVFRSLGCNSLPERAYVHLAFEVLHWNTSEACYRTLFSDFLDWRNRNGFSDETVNIEFRIRPASYLEHELNGWSVSIHFDFQSSGLEQITKLRLFLEEVSEFLQPQLINCHKTMSSGSAASARVNAA